MKIRSQAVAVAFVALASFEARAQDVPPANPLARPPVIHNDARHFGSSPFAPPEMTDTNFTVDQSPGLDTGCTYGSGGPLVFKIAITRVIGDRSKLLNSGLLAANAALRMPAFDVDFDAAIPGINPERDRVFFNGHAVRETFLTGANNVWKENNFQIPVDWVNFATANASGPPTPGDNEIRIDIDTANSSDQWCTAIDWASLSFKVARPAVLVHGIFSSGSQAWGGLWGPKLDQLGLPNSTALNMGALDSIENNAGKIGVEVAKAKTRWGVDKVNLICHSKGGLDARHYVESHSDVAQVIQIGTPNAGSPWADLARAALIALQAESRLPVVFLSDLTLPAGRQLTTGSMALYNLFHSHNTNVTYTALAGDYDPDCAFLLFGCPEPAWALASVVAGEGDGIVPVSSVHALSYMGQRTFASQGSNLDSVHTHLTEASGVFSSLIDRTADTSKARVAPPAAVPSRTATEGGDIAAGETRTLFVPVEARGPASISLLYASADLKLALTSPTGVHYDASSVAGQRGVSHQVTALEGNVLEVYQFANAEAGIWRADVSATTVGTATGRVSFAVHAWFAESEIRLSGSASPQVVSVGQQLTVRATLLRGTGPLTRAETSVLVGRPDGEITRLPLRDDGTGGDSAADDGIYSAAFLPNLAGTYQLTFKAAGTPASNPAQFSREAFGVAAVASGGAQLTNVFGSRGVDTDGNGLFNQLAVDIGLNVGAPGDYRLLGVLTDTAGNRHEASWSGALAAGSQTATLPFDGREIYAQGIDGPYTLSELRLAEEGEVGVLPLAESVPGWATTSFGFREFEHPPIALAGTGSAEGVDTNGNGLFDRLDVLLDLDLDAADFYSWSARLIDPLGREVGFTSGSGSLSAGRQSILLPYSGPSIGQSGLDGPYTVADLLVFGSNASLISDRAFTTADFEARQFEGFVGDTMPPTLTVTLSPSGLFPPEHQLISVQAAITASDDKDAQPTVKLLSITSSEADSGLDPRDVPNDVQDATFGTDDRTFLLRAEKHLTSRSYRVTYEARDAAGNTATRTATVLVQKPK